MTKPDDVTVSDAEGLTGCRTLDLPDHKLPMVKRMLAAFLAARVPDAIRVPSNDTDMQSTAMAMAAIYGDGHNALRAAMLAARPNNGGTDDQAG